MAVKAKCAAEHRDRVVEQQHLAMRTQAADLAVASRISDLYAARFFLLQQSQHRRIDHTVIDDPDAFLRLLDQCRDALPGMFGADNEPLAHVARIERRRSPAIRFKQPQKAVDEFRILRNQQEVAGVAKASLG